MADPSGGPAIVHLSAEYWPYIRTGGLGEAVQGIATQQARMGSETFAFLPLYQAIRESGYELTPAGEPFSVPLGPGIEESRLWEVRESAGGVRVILVEHEEYFHRPGVYGEAGGDYPDNYLRFAFFSAAVLKALPGLVDSPVVLHMHDWHTAFAVIFLRTLMDGDPFADGIASVLSVHNGGYQGHFPPGILPEIGLPTELYRMDFLEWYGRANILKAGLKATDMATTVSAGHAFELRTEAGGFGLHHTFLGLRGRLVGVTNGIDFSLWNPATDPAIPANYSQEDLSGKAICKTAVQEEYCLEVDPDRLLVGMVARMVAQKGLDLIVGGRSVREPDAQFIFMGSGEPRFAQALAQLAAAHPGRIAVEPSFTDAGEHRVLAGADALLMPSLYEPCGLTQMRGQRYGAVPLARRVGGLEETIEDGVTGLLFDDFKPERLDWLIDRAVAWHRRPEAWQILMREGMARDYSWAPRVKRYYDIYDRALQIRAQALASGPGQR